MRLGFLPANPTVAEVDHAIYAARRAAAEHRAAGDEALALLAEQAVDAAFEVRKTLRQTRCYADHRCTATPMAAYTFVSGNTVRVCRDHLNLWLDMADDEEIDEPAGLTWLRYPASVT